MCICERMVQLIECEDPRNIVKTDLCRGRLLLSGHESSIELLEYMAFDPQTNTLIVSMYLEEEARVYRLEH